MKPAPFDYAAPKTLREVIDTLKSGGDSAKLLAGGQSLVPMLAMRLARPTLLVDLNRVDGLSGIRRDNGHLVIGAMTRDRELETNQTVRQTLPVLAEMVSYIGHVAIRNRGTIGGSLAHADPAAELPLAMVVLDASLTVQGPSGPRTLKSEQLFQSAMTTSLAADEILTEIRVPISPSQTRSSFMELARRHGDFAIVAVLTLVQLDKQGRYVEVRIGVGGASPVPIRIRDAEQQLKGEKPSAAAVSAAAKTAAKTVSPSSDNNGGANYRREIVETLTRRTLLAASGIQ